MARPARSLTLGEGGPDGGDRDVWNPELCHGGTHVSAPERSAFARLCRFGLVDAYRLHHEEPGRYTWWDYRAGHFHKNFAMRIDHLLVTAPLAEWTVWAEIDREARKGKPTPSDHAPLVVDLDERGEAFDAGWTSAEGALRRASGAEGFLVAAHDGAHRAERDERLRRERRRVPRAMVGPAGRAGHQPNVSVHENNRRRHRRER